MVGNNEKQGQRMYTNSGLNFTIPVYYVYCLTPFFFPETNGSSYSRKLRKEGTMDRRKIRKKGRRKREHIDSFYCNHLLRL